MTQFWFRTIVQLNISIDGIIKLIMEYWNPMVTALLLFLLHRYHGILCCPANSKITRSYFKNFLPTIYFGLGGVHHILILLLHRFWFCSKLCLETMAADKLVTTFANAKEIIDFNETLADKLISSAVAKQILKEEGHVTGSELDFNSKLNTTDIGYATKFREVSFVKVD